MEPNNISLLGRFFMLKELYVSVQHVVQLTTPLLQLHKLGMRFEHGTLLRGFYLQRLLSHAPALRQLELDCKHVYADRAVPCGCWASCCCGLNRCDMEVLACLQCQQLDLLTVTNSTIDDESVKLLAHIQSPLKLRMDIVTWSFLESAPLFTLLAGLPNLTALTLIRLHEALNALWDQGGATLPYVQRLEVFRLPLGMSDWSLSLQSIVSMCPALKHLYLRSYPI